MTDTLVFRSARCTGCFNCVLACKHENRTGPGVSWIRVEEHQARDPDRVLWLLRICVHCQDAPCLQRCPTGALTQSADGVVRIDAALCAPDCWSCASACPHDALFKAPSQGYFADAKEREADNQDHHRHQPGSMTLCTLCAHRQQDGLAPACVDACPTASLTWEDLGGGERVRYVLDPALDAVDVPRLRG